MAGPSWLAWAFAGVMIVVAAYCLTRLLASWRQHRPTDHRVDGIHVLMGVAMAGMLVPRLAVFWVGGWEVVFGIGAAWFGGLAIREFRGQPTVGGRPGHHLQHVLACVAMLYMFLAAATVTKAAAGGSAMSGMAASGAHFRTLALVLAFPVRIRGLERGPALVAGSRSPPRTAARRCRPEDPQKPGEFVSSPPVCRDVQDRDGDHHGVHADPDALACDLVSGFFDGIPQRDVAGYLFGGDPDLASRNVDVDVGHAGKLADLSPGWHWRSGRSSGLEQDLPPRR